MAEILVIGGSGFIGRRLLAHLGPQRAIGSYYAAPFPGGVSFDSANERLADRFFTGRHGVTHGILLQGITGLDRCALAPEESARVNVEGAVNAIDDMLDAGVVPIYVSSDSVFDGSRGACTEADPVSPILTYGRQASEVETYLAGLSASWGIARLTKVVASFPSPRNILSEWVDAVTRGDLIRCAHDQILSPVDIDDVVAALSFFIGNDLRGLYNISGPKSLSRIELLNTLLTQLSPRLRRAARVDICSLDDISLVEHRPKNCSLSDQKFASASGLVAAAPDVICSRLGQYYREELRVAAAAR